MLHFLGLTLMMIGGVMLLPIPLTPIFGEFSLIPCFLFPALIAFAAGGFLWKRFEERELNTGEAMALAAFAWLIIMPFGSIPFILGAGLDPLSALFESMSGFTTTGLTMFKMGGPGLIDAPRTILFWRSLTQWVGGLGIMVLFLSTVIGAGRVSKRLFSAEGGGGRVGPAERKSPEVTIRSIARSTWKIYVFYTAAAALILWLIGMSGFEAVNHAMTALATGGFSVTSDSFATYSDLILVVACLPMVAGATSFVTHIRLTKGNLRSLLENHELKLMLLLMGISTLILSWNFGWADALFSSVTAQTTVGFSSVGEGGLMNGPNWGALEKSIIIVQMVIGGSFGSTAGAIKLIRTIILAITLYWLVKKAILPDRAVIPIKIGGETLSIETVLRIATFGFAYLVLLTIGSLITMAAIPEATAINCVFDSASAQGTVGLSTGITGIGMPAIVKIIFIIQMWIGRLEVIPVVALFGYSIHRTPKRDTSI